MEPHGRPSHRVLMTARVIWAGLLLSPILLALIAWVLLFDRPAWPEDVSFSDPLVLILLFVAVSGFFVALKVEEFFLSSARRTSNEDDGQRMLRVHIVKLALFEVPATIGFSLAVFNSALVVLVPFLLLSFLGFAVSYPNDERWRGGIK